MGVWKKFKIIFSASVSAILISGAFLALYHPDTNHVKNAELTLLNTGTSSSIAQNVTYSYGWANISIVFSGPRSLQPDRLVFYVTNVTHEVQAPDLPYFSGHWLTVPGINVTYPGNSYPNWVATFEKVNSWTGYTGVVTNPDGRIVGGSVSNGTFYPGDTAVNSSAILRLTFPAYVTSLQGYVVEAIYSGTTIASVNLTLNG